jgi:hypothetical protein
MKPAQPPPHAAPARGRARQLASSHSARRPSSRKSTSATLRGAATASTRVTATNTATGLTRSVQSSADGNYVLAGLPPACIAWMSKADSRAPSRCRSGRPSR